MKKSIVTKELRVCAVCGCPAECTHHLVFGVGKRAIADSECLTLPLCNRHHDMGNITERIHDNPAAELLSKMVGELAWEKHYIAQRSEIPFEDLEDEAREAFRDKFGKTYL